MRHLFEWIVSSLPSTSLLNNKLDDTTPQRPHGVLSSKGSGDAPSCPLDTPLSCLNSTEMQDTCCYEYPGGIFLLTQFWDYSEPLNTANDTEQAILNKTFTLHGLWPDNCDGSYEQFCAPELDIVAGQDLRAMLLDDAAYSDTRLPALETSGAQLLSEMELFWKSNSADDSSLWTHEYNKHGTCIRTMNPECYARWFDVPTGSGTTLIEDVEKIKRRAAYDYFRTTMKLFKKLDTYAVLEQAGIVPSVDKTYSRQEISDALRAGFGDNDVFFKCDRNGALNEIWYFHLVGKGSVLLSESFVPIDSFKKYSNCPVSEIHYYPRGHNPRRGGGGGGGGGGDKDKKRVGTGTLRVSSTKHSPSGGVTGFITRLGRWMSKGTEAKFDVYESEFGNYVVKSSAGYCSVEPDKNSASGSGKKTLSCRNSNKNRATQFEIDWERGKNRIGYGGEYTWHSPEFPRGRQQSQVYHGSPEDSQYSFELKFHKLY